jgi:hypothetical protein
VPVSSIAKDNEGHKDGELILGDGENINVIVHATQNTAINCFRTIDGDTHQTISVTNDTPDDKSITSTKLGTKISEYDDLSVKRDQLLAVLTKYQSHLTKRPGKCTGFEYHFNIEGKLPESASPSTIPFALRKEVAAQIQVMYTMVLYLYLRVIAYKCLVNALFR